MNITLTPVQTKAIKAIRDEYHKKYGRTCMLSDAEVLVISQAFISKKAGGLSTNLQLIVDKLYYYARPEKLTNGKK